LVKNLYQLRRNCIFFWQTFYIEPLYCSDGECVKITRTSDVYLMHRVWRCHCEPYLAGTTVLGLFVIEDNMILKGRSHCEQRRTWSF